jgi:hypothetical protein
MTQTSARFTIKGAGMSSKEAAACSDRAARAHARRSRLSALLIAVVLATATLAFSAGPAFATTTDVFFVVASGGSATSSCQSVGSSCTLAWALSQATSGTYAGDNMVIVLGSGTYTESDYEIAGGSLNQLTLQSSSISPVGTVLDGGATNTPLTIDATYQVAVLGVTLQNGGGAGPGADLLDEGSGTVAVNGDVISGGLTSPANASLVEATNGLLSVADTTVEAGGSSMNGVESSGGAEVEVEDSTITGEGDGIDADGSEPFTVTDSTLDDNEVGVADNATGVVVVTDSTISSSLSAGIGIILNASVIDLGGNILTNAGASDGDCAYFGGTVDDLGYNVTDDNTCGFGTADGNTVASTSAIGLLSLASNGGPTQTQRITSTSAAYDFVPAGTADCVADAYDQRGVPFLQAGASGCDAGAYQVAPPTLTSITSAAAEPDELVTLTGTNLQGVTGVAFGTSDAAATIQSQTSDSLTVAVPMLTVGSQPITVTSPDGTATIGFTVSADPTITTSSLPSAEVGQPYSETLAVSGGASPREFNITAGALPAGLTLSGSGTISGTPTSASSSTFTVEVTDLYGHSSTADLSLSVSAAPVTPPVTPPASAAPVTAPARTPTGKIESTSIKLQGKSGKVKLACETATCAGKMEIVKTVREKVKKGKKTIEETKTLVLASGSYRLAAGKTESFVIKLTTIGRKDLLASAAKPVHETLLITVTGGHSRRRTVKLT